MPPLLPHPITSTLFSYVEFVIKSWKVKCIDSGDMYSNGIFRLHVISPSCDHGQIMILCYCHI